MRKHLAASLAVLSGTLLAFSCAKSEKSSLNEDNKYYFDAWIALNYPGAEPSGHGIYLLEDRAGTGEEYQDQLIVSVDYTVTDLEGNVQNTTSKTLSQQLGSYAVSDYYGERIWVVGEGTVTAGVEDMLKGMRVGGVRKAAIPSWLNVSKRYDKAEDYFKHKSEQPHAIYEITLRNIIENLEEWECDSLKRYSRRCLGGMDTTSYGFYYRQLRAPVSTKEFSSDTTVYINYIGRRLDGTVFDTNIADTAKVHQIYDPSQKYGPSEIRWGEKPEDIEMIKDGVTSGLIAGFQKTLWQMREFEEGTGVFVSRFGYALNGSGQTIPPCCPLRFDVEMVGKPDQRP